MTSHMTPRNPETRGGGHNLRSDHLIGRCCVLAQWLTEAVLRLGGPTPTLRRPIAFFCRILWTGFSGSGGDIAEEERGARRGRSLTMWNGNESRRGSRILPQTFRNVQRRRNVQSSTFSSETHAETLLKSSETLLKPSLVFGGMFHPIPS